MSMQGRTGLRREDLTRYQSSTSQLDTIFSPLYDYQIYPAAGLLQFNFFALPVGQGVTSAFGGAGGVKTLADTNMQVAGQLPAGNRFLALGIEVEFWPGSVPGTVGAAAIATAVQAGANWNDVNRVLNNGFLTFTVQNRNFAQDAPLIKFPTQTRLAGQAAVSQTTNAAASFLQVDYAQGCGAGYNIVPVLLSPTQAFNVQINFPALVPTVSTVAGRIGVRLVGKLVRNVQ
jgi:hypothetical protein